MQDVVIALGSFCKVFYKADDKMKIYSFVLYFRLRFFSFDYFYNYFILGIVSIGIYYQYYGYGIFLFVFKV